MRMVRVPVFAGLTVALGAATMLAQNRLPPESPRPIDAAESLWAEELTSMEIRDAAARGRTRMAFRQNVRTNQGTSSAYDLRDSTLQVRATDDVDPLERAHKSTTVWLGVCRCDARDGPPRDDKHHTEISQSWNGLPDDVSDCSSCASRSGSRDRSS